MLKEYENLKITNIDDLFDSMKNIESMIRRSRSYRNVLRYLKEDCSLRYSLTFPNIDFVEEKLSYEMHHIITLGSLVILIGSKMISDLKKDEYLLEFDIAKKVIEYHLEDKVPLIMLSKTEHELVHTGEFTFTKEHPSIHLGKTQEFINEYKELLSDSEIKLLQSLGFSFKEGSNE